MEALILLVVAIAELFAVVIPAAIMFAVELLGVVLQLIFEAVGALLSKRQEKSLRTETPTPSQQSAASRLAPSETDIAAAQDSAALAESDGPSKAAIKAAHLLSLRKWVRRLSLASGGTLLLSVGAVFILNTFFFETTLRWALSKVDQNSGVAITFDNAKGSLWTGRVELSGAKVKRQNSPVSDYDLSIEILSIDVAIKDALKGKARFEEIYFRGAEGEYQRYRPAEKTGKKRTFIVDSLLVEDVNIAFIDHTFKKQPFQTTLEVEQFRSEPFRSNWAVFDVLFRSNGKGKIDGAPFLIYSKEVDGEKLTHWKVTDLRIEHLGQQFGGPFRWIEEGRFDVDVTDRWRDEESLEIETHCAFVLRDLRVQPPEDVSLTVKTISKPIVAFLNKKGKRLPLEFDMTLDEGRFEAKYSPEVAGLGDSFLTGITAEIARQNGLNPEQLKEKAQAKGRQLMNNLKDKIKFKLKKKEENKDQPNPGDKKDEE